MGDERATQAPGDGLDEVGGLLGDDVDAVARELLGEVLEVAVVEVDEVPRAVDLADRAGVPAQAVPGAAADPDDGRARRGGAAW